MPSLLIESIGEQIKPICEKYHVKRLRMFGSTVRGENRPDCDVDLLVDYEEGFSPTFFSMGGLEEELSPLFDHRPIDLMRPHEVHWFIRKSVLSSAQNLYEG